MTTDFYDQRGTPVAYAEGETIYLFSGQPVGYLSGDAVYTYGGAHIGWFESGWIRDLDGYCVFFTSDATGGPLKPLKQLKPLKGLKHLKPLKGLKQLKFAKAMKTSAWSQLSGPQFFSEA